jgi:hypothetical protein
VATRAVPTGLEVGLGDGVGEELAGGRPVGLGVLVERIAGEAVIGVGVGVGVGLELGLGVTSGVGPSEGEATAGEAAAGEAVGLCGVGGVEIVGVGVGVATSAATAGGAGAGVAAGGFRTLAPFVRWPVPSRLLPEVAAVGSAASVGSGVAVGGDEAESEGLGTWANSVEGGEGSGLGWPPPTLGMGSRPA